MEKNTPLHDESGKIYGILTVISYVGHRSYEGDYWLCRCECGRETIPKGRNLRSGNTKSCGCQKKLNIGERTRKHGHSRLNGGRHSPEYKAWTEMRQRCYNKSNHKFPIYGGRGISVCEEWRDDFAPFYDHIGPRPSPLHSLDRIKVDGNYEPGNVRWATRREQARNRRSSIDVTVNGQTMPLKEAVKLSPLAYIAVYKRLRKGWPIETALFAPAMTGGRPKPSPRGL